MNQRLDKIIASSGTMSRREVHDLIQKGRVTVNGAVVRKKDHKCDPEIDVITVNGERLDYYKNVYIMMHKPRGVLSASRDKSRRTVVNLAEEQIGRRGLFPVGRLDKDTTGLLLITDDGDFAHRVISPKSHVDKLYFAELDGAVTDEMIAAFAQGVTLADGTPCLPAKLVRRADNDHLAEVTVCEGKYHQIKRMFGVVGLGVVNLHRQRIGALTLDPGLKEGQCRLMTAAEIAAAEQSDQAEIT